MAQNSSSDAIEIAILTTRMDNTSGDLREIKGAVKDVNIKVDGLAINLGNIQTKLETMKSFNMGVAAAISVIVSFAIPVFSYFLKGLASIFVVMPKA